ncbi:glycosyltransferase [Scandinavium goeteborgense]|uniref:glycosyltransferase family 2 protein n=1 Tax=Scandinavium goeteborgense TaxID=1851514 RepID=UPI0021669D5F|nr:glycosyltransferase family 2 protein [Scandinavium goeteborgense]MCS2154919.1 glycosyltransferase [Scandinavium goeteborgense]
MKHKLVSIIMPAYNAGNTITESIKSVLSQTYPIWELLICDDNSQDNTVLQVLTFDDSRVKVFPNEYDKGAAGARNTALKYAAGRYIAFLDSDDLWVDNKLELQLRVMRANNIAFVYGNYLTISNGVKTGVLIAPKEVTYRSLLKKCDIGCLTVMLDRTLLEDFHFPSYYKEDYYLWLQILQSNKIVAKNCGDICSLYRLSSSSLSSNKTREIYRQWKVLTHFVSNPAYRTYYILCYIWHGLKKHVIYYKKGI